MKQLFNSLFASRTTKAEVVPTHAASLLLPDHPDAQIELKRTRRKKTVAIRVGDNQIQISAPKQLALYQIQKLLLKRSDWISKQLEYQATRPDKPTALIKQYIDGEPMHYLGRAYRLAISGSEYPAHSVKLYAGQLQVTRPYKQQNPEQSRDGIKKAIAQWYRQRAEERLPKIVAQRAAIIGVNYSAIEIRHFKSRWGSCRADGKLQFNWRLMMASPEVIEYVVVHELCHRIHLNHSRLFWDEVEKYAPNFRQHRRWLNKNGHLIEL